MFKIGDRVETSEGPGEVVAYDGFENGRIYVVCLDDGAGKDWLVSNGYTNKDFGLKICLEYTLKIVHKSISINSADIRKAGEEDKEYLSRRA